MPRRPNHLLSGLEQRFVEEYLIDLNKTQAAIRAGYSARSARSHVIQVVKRPHVRAAIDQAMAERARRVAFDHDRVIQALAVAAFGNPRTLFGEDGELLPMHELSDAVTALGANLDIVARIKDDGNGPSPRPSGPASGRPKDRLRGFGRAGGSIKKTDYVVKVRLPDRVKALELLGRHLGLFQDRADLSDGEPPAITVTFVRPGDGRDEADALNAPNATPLDDLR